MLADAAITVINPSAFSPESASYVPMMIELSKGRGKSPPHLYLVDDSNEGHPSRRYTKRIEDLAGQLGVDLFRIILLNQNENFRLFSAPSENGLVANSAVFNRQFERATEVANSLSDSEVVGSEDRDHYRYRFLSLNNKPRPHRIALTSLMKEAGLLEQTALSFHFARPNAQKNKDYFVDRAISMFPHYADEIRKFISETYFPVVLESKEERRNFWGLPSVSSRCLWFIVTESNFSIDTPQRPVRRVTEKTLKALVYGRPFLVLGEAQTLGYLHELGFRTYGCVIDESYDLVINPHRRMEAFMETVRQIACNPTTRGELKTMRKIAQHNRDWLVGGFKEHFSLREAKHLEGALVRAGLSGH